jgi:hypothetical protein
LRIARRALRDDAAGAKTPIRKHRHGSDIVGRAPFGCASGQGAPRQVLGSCQMIEQLFCVSTAIVVAGAKEQDTLHRRMMTGAGGRGQR